MKSTGIVRRIDELGRIVLPIELRRTLDLAEKDAMEIFTNGRDLVVLKKYKPACVFCGSDQGVVMYKGKCMCKSCIDDIKIQETPGEAIDANDEPQKA